MVPDHPFAAFLVNSPEWGHHGPSSLRCPEDPGSTPLNTSVVASTLGTTIAPASALYVELIVSVLGEIVVVSTSLLPAWPQNFFKGFWMDGACTEFIRYPFCRPFMSLYCGLSSNHVVFEHYLTQVTSEVFESLSTLRVSVMCLCQGAASRILPTV